ncbi:MAG TPA: condensation domain-containing protein [Solirubrobacteraceae bacterium]|jgi:hypothetical protein|nr:condensation domain-containing protein [Solirubrobacteraceae bacterium]
MPSSAPSIQAQPVTATQEELWALSAANAPPAAVNLGYALAVDGPLDPAALRAAFAAAVERYPALRSTYAWRGDALVVEPQDADFGALGLPAEPEPESVAGGADAVAAFREERNRRFALDAEPPYRLRLLREPSGRHVFLLTLHHIVADGWALDLLTLFLTRAYAQAVAGGSLSANGSGGAAAAPAPAQPPAAPRASAEQVQAYVDRLGDAAPVVGAFGAAERPSVVDMQRECVLIDAAQTARLRELARASGASLFAVLLAAAEAALSAWSQTGDFILGSLAANRGSAAAGEVMGAYYNPVLLRASLPPDPTVADALLGANDALLRALEDQAIPYRAARAALRERLGAAADRVPAAMMLLDWHPLKKLELAGCTVTPLHLDDGGPRTPLPGGGPRSSVTAASVADLTFFARDAGERLTISALVPHEHPAAADLVPLLDGFARALELFDEAPETPLAALAADLGDGPPAPEPAGGGAEAALREITEIAPIDALSPVGVWTDERTRT